jgi:tRNA dimethylallyltransferase
MTGLGYRQIGEHLLGEATLEEAIARIKQGTRRFVQQQYNWFQPADPAIHWIDPAVMSIRDVMNMMSVLIRKNDHTCE